MSTLHNSIIKTLVYSDVFDYPLTFLQLWKFLINCRYVSKKELKQELSNIKSIKCIGNTWYCFFDRLYIVDLRRKRENESKKKIIKAKKAAYLLARIPTIQLIGISGALAMRNAKENDDIDFFIITKNNTLWMSRFTVLCVLSALAQRRKRGQKDISDTICVNMLMDEAALALPKSRKDLYTAHEVVQMKPLFERNGAYKKFLEANAWVRRFLPNSIEICNRQGNREMKDNKISLLHCFEFFAKRIQMWHAKSHTTTEILSDHLIAFHPKDYRNDILRTYRKRLKQYEYV